MTKAYLYLGDCRDNMRRLKPDSVDSIVCDPPYGLEFMGKGWDHGVPGVEFWQEALRVLKPGGHLVAFGGTRTYHRLGVAIEDAGFEIRDCLSWMYGSGFPKSMDVSKAIDKAAGAKREVVGEHPYAARKPNGTWDGLVYGDEPTDRKGPKLTAPATAAAAEWDGWGTALKPAWEPIILARKPLPKGSTVAKNVLTHGTGAINIDATRIGENPGYKYNADRNGTTFHGEQGNRIVQTAEKKGAPVIESSAGRWPANVLLTHHEDCNGSCVDTCPVRLLDEQTGTLTSGKAAKGGHKRVESKGSTGGAALEGNADGSLRQQDEAGTLYGDKGGASRFFYSSKVAKKERNAGLDGVNDHPTVKPIAVMEWLIKLVTPPGGVVLDPFMGSGSTGCAAVKHGFPFVGMDLDNHYLWIAAFRLKHAGAEKILGRHYPEDTEDPDAEA